MLKYLFLIMFFIVSALHLDASFKDDAERRKRSKPFLLILLLLYYVCASKQRSILLILALLTSWLGDVLLIPKGHKWFTLGGISFMFSHLFFVLVYSSRISFQHIVWPLVLPAALVYFGISYRIITMVKETTPARMIPPMHFYLICNSTMNIFALMQLFSLRNGGALTAYIGAVLFFISDCTLFLVRYYKDPDIIYKKHFTVMLTYLLGEYLIVAGILMLNG
ncbi:MAG: lysoplasmalogenase [Solobacterium sp.]|nr:lysoplasmalogenase [Solobacterium sp.]